MCFDCWFSAIEHHHFLGRLGTCHGPGYVVPDMHDCWELGGFCQEAFFVTARKLSFTVEGLDSGEEGCGEGKSQVFVD